MIHSVKTCADSAVLCEKRGGNTFADLYAKAVLVIAKLLSIIAINPWLAPQKLTPLLPRKKFWLQSYLRFNQIANGSYKNTKL